MHHVLVVVVYAHVCDNSKHIIKILRNIIDHKNFFKDSSQDDAGTQHSVTSVGMILELTQVQLKRYLTSVSHHPTNHIVQKFDTRN